MRIFQIPVVFLVLLFALGCGSVPPTMEAAMDSEDPIATDPIPEEVPEPPVPVDTAPEGEAVNEEVLSDPGQIGTVWVIFAQDGQFLGQVNDNRFDSDSLCNRFGTYGNKFSALSIWNRFGTYGRDFAPLSAFNDLSSSPPILFDEFGAVAFVTTNNLLTPRIDSFFLLGLLQASGCDVER